MTETQKWVGLLISSLNTAEGARKLNIFYKKNCMLKTTEAEVIEYN